ncbi:MAG: M6 family metalloprotease domain-containing protein [Longimicrobiales bacterium]
MEAQQTANLPAPWHDVKPPAEIAGLSDARPAAPLEFSRAWLRRMESVRLVRAELMAAGELDGLSPDSAARLGAALTGTLHVPVIPVRYVDVAEPFPHTALAERLFGAGAGDTMSYSGYWHEASGGLLEVTGMVAPWVKLTGSTSHYLSADQQGWGHFGRIVELRTEALTIADSTLDFGNFDNDGADGVPNSGDDDGFVDFVAFLYALPCPGDARAGGIWPHRAAMEPFETGDMSANGSRIRIADYLILPAVDDETCGPLHVGVLAHETGHALGLPDLYDYDGSTQGIGAWGLMGTGAHAASFSPAHPGAWAKEQLGWVQVDWLESGDTLRLESVENSRTIKRYDAPAGDGYLLFENRQQLGSDAHVPGHGLLAWRVDPERGEIGAWNNDERRAAVRIVAAEPDSHLLGGLRATANDPYPGKSDTDRFIAKLSGGFALSSIEEHDGVITADVAVGYIVPTLIASPAIVRMTVRVGGAPVTQHVAIRAEGGATPAWQPSTRARWLRVTAKNGELELHADPGGLRPGLYGDTVQLVDADDQSLAAVPVSMYIAADGRGQTVATELPWSWGLAVGAGRILQASYGWDPLGLRPRPRLLALREGDTHPSTLVRLPADALYAPVLHADGSAHVLARTRGRNMLFYVAANGDAELVVDDLGGDPAYGLTTLPDGDLLVAEWSGRLLRVRLADGLVSEYAELPARIYQIASDGTGVVFAATYDGSVLRIEPSGAVTVIQTGFGIGRLVAIAVTADGTLFVAERGGAGRIMRIDGNGMHSLVFRRPGAEFYGLAVARDHFIYALDLNARELLRFPLHDLPRTANRRNGECGMENGVNGRNAECGMR